MNTKDNQRDNWIVDSVVTDSEFNVILLILCTTHDELIKRNASDDEIINKCFMEV